MSLLLALAGVSAAAPTITVPDDTPSLAIALALVDDGGTVVVRESYATELGYVFINRPVSVVGDGRPTLPGILATSSWSLTSAVAGGAAPTLEVPGWDAGVVQLEGDVTLQDVELSPPPGAAGLYASGAVVTATQ